MKIKTIVITSLLLLASPTLIFAEYKATIAKTPVQTLKQIELQSCLTKAEVKRNKLYAEALTDYTTGAGEVKKDFETKLESIDWYITSSYRIHSRKLLAEEKSSLDEVGKRSHAKKEGALLTEVVEKSLCQKLYGTATSTKTLPKQK